jgi:hypothetical protein
MVCPHSCSLYRSFWLKICWDHNEGMKRKATSWAMEEKVAQCEEPAISAVLMATMREIARSLEERMTLYEELVTAAVLMAISRGIARGLQESCSTAKAVARG